ncbi:hypothetical protein Tcan_01941 [Toxocara canis]|uniref:Uncharacterized protein n=1 Tax=Toxocara canis TaxID=6265 RepID=A0A0B2V943_TOXCA|nr:hypothetical protein Tcan_01941 [Toxocara canis]
MSITLLLKTQLHAITQRKVCFNKRATLGINNMEERPMHIAYDDDLTPFYVKSDSFRRNCFFSPVQCMFRRSVDYSM